MKASLFFQSPFFQEEKKTVAVSLDEKQIRELQKWDTASRVLIFESVYNCLLIPLGNYLFLLMILFIMDDW